jgi:hypothetical protein
MRRALSERSLNSSKTTKFYNVPRYHLYVKYDWQEEKWWGFDDHCGAHHDLQHIITSTKNLPPGSHWQVVDMLQLKVVTRSEEMKGRKGAH